MTSTSSGPRRYSPGAAPAAPIASVTSTSRSGAKVATSAISAGCMWTPSAMISSGPARLPELQHRPGRRWWIGAIALKRWVAWLAPASKASFAVA